MNFNKLWKLLIDKKMMKKDPQELAGLSTSVSAKMEKGGDVSAQALRKNCTDLDCNENEFSNQRVTNIDQTHNAPHETEPNTDAEGTTMALQCAICGDVSDQPLSLSGDGSFEGAQIVAYDSVFWPEDLKNPPAPGSVETVSVTNPFYCRVGDSFTSTFKGDHFITAKLLEIVETDGFSATIRIQILSVGGLLHFVKRLSEMEKKALAQTRAYQYTEPDGDFFPSFIPSDSFLYIENGFGGGDVSYIHYLYTDEDGIDHLVKTAYQDFEQNHSFFGDQVLGLHQYSPYSWENGLLINRLRQVVLSCEKGATDVVIPTGIRFISNNAFSNANLQRLTIPYTVQHLHLGFGKLRYPNLNSITLSKAGNPKVEEMLRAEFSDASFSYSDD